MAHPHSDCILGLPMEALESIGDLCDPATDILALRLSCRTLAAATFRTFTTEYISKLYCFMLDPKRLQRVINILDQPHLAARVTVVQLTLLAAERQSSHPVASAEHGYYYQENLDNDYAEEEYNRLECPAHGISADCWSQIRRIVTRVAQGKRSWIAFNVCAERRVHSRIATKKPDLPFQLLDLTIASDCKVKRYCLSNAFEAHVTDFGPTKKYNLILQDLQKFAYVCQSFRYRDLYGAKISRQCDLVRVVNEESPNLRDLRLVVYKPSWPLAEDCMSVSQRILAGPALPSLRTVFLSGLQCQQIDILGFLERCPPRLENFWMDDVAVSHSHDPLTEILEALARFPKLQELQLHGLSVHSKWAIRKFPQFIVSETGMNERIVNPRLEGLDARRFLEVNLRERVEYTEPEGRL